MKCTVLFLLVFSQLSFAMDYQGHRGARGLYPENTIGAMEEALKYPVTTLELDVVISKDKQIVVSHEPWMNEEICLDPEGNRFKGKKHNIYKLNYEDVTKFDCGSIPYERFPRQKKISTGKPTLNKLIDVTEKKLKALNREDISYNIEIKSTPEDERDGFQPNVKTFSDLVVNFLVNKLPNDKFTIQSFDWRVLQYIHKTYPKVRLVALMEGSIEPEKNLKTLGFNPFVFSPYFKFLKSSDVEAFHKKGIKVIVWTVNDVPEVEKFKKMNVDGIITDYPDLITKIGKKDCGEKANLFEGKCVTVPTHALPSSSNPGWVCKPGYIQKRSGCTKIKVPDHAKLLPDGKTWECLEGFKRYRSKCKKY